LGFSRELSAISNRWNLKLQISSEQRETMAACSKCGAKLGLLEGSGTGICSYCRKKLADEQKLLDAEADKKREIEIISAYNAAKGKLRDEVIASETLEKISCNIILTTGDSIPDKEIGEIIDIVGAEAAFGLNIFKDIANSLRDVFGGRSGVVQNAAKDARKICISEIKQAAALIGADAVVSMRFEFSQVSSNAGTSGIFFVAATGTAVKLKN
jgi:uncharacterized protein YbjQ (UPF0145 family)/DNA-directed RNA polymerase subunit RPC12/RpoP